jgi:hypothetical protein
MTLKEQLLHGDHLFRQIDDLVLKRQPTKATEIVLNSNPPESWVIELQSISNPNEKFKSLKLELMEAVARRIFGHYQIKEIQPPIIVQDKQGNFAVTVIVDAEIMSFDGELRSLPGIATETIGNIRLLPLATPKASSMAVKNALKQLGRLFGKYLNTEADDVEIPIEDIKPSVEDQKNAVTEGIMLSKSISDLKSWRSLVYSKMGSKEQQDLYETKLRQLSN